MNFVVPDFYPAAAEIFVAVMALVIMLASTFARSIARNLSYFLTQATLIGAAFITILTMEGEVVHTFSNMFIGDLMGDFLKLMIYFSTAIALLYGRGYLADRKIDKPEYYLLALLMTLGPAMFAWAFGEAPLRSFAMRHGKRVLIALDSDNGPRRGWSGFTSPCHDAQNSHAVFKRTLSAEEVAAFLSE